MGIKFLAGRDFTVDDKPGAPGVAIVNRSCAGTWSARSADEPIYVRVPYIDPRNVLTIVAVVEDVWYSRSTIFPSRPTTTRPRKARRGDRRSWSRPLMKQTTALQSATGDELRKIDPQMAVDIDSATHIVETHAQPPVARHDADDVVWRGGRGRWRRWASTA